MRRKFSDRIRDLPHIDRLMATYLANNGHHAHRAA
jgi:hypothetical protein